MKETAEILFNIFMFVFIAGSMITTGLALTISQIAEPFKNVKMVVLSVVANFIIIPLFAFGLIWLIPVSEGLRTGLILLSISAGAPFIPKIVEKAKVREGGAVGLMLLLLIVTIFFMPIVVPILFSGAAVSPWDIAKSLLFSMLMPLSLALFVNARFSDFAKQIQPFFSKLTNISVFVLLILVVYLYTKLIISNASTLPVILLFFLGAMGIGYLTGGKNKEARFILSVGTGLRNPPIAMMVASMYFSSEPMAAIAPLLVIIVGLSILFPLASKIGKKKGSTTT